MTETFHENITDRRETLRRLAMLRPIDDIFMYQMFKDNIPLTELLLRRTIGVESISVQSVDVQYDLDLRAAGSRSLRLDVLATRTGIPTMSKSSATTAARRRKGRATTSGLSTSALRDRAWTSRRCPGLTSYS